MSTDNSYRALLTDGKFEAFLWTQFLGAFNDNVYKIIVSIMAVRSAADSASSSRYLAIAGAVFVIPFLLFAGYAGQLADRYSKTRVLQVTKSFEVITMLVGIVALVSGRIEVLLAVLFLLATQANFFSPAKYGILPEITTEAGISRANGLLELTTFAAIVLGTSFGTFLFERWKDAPFRMGGTLLVIAVVGTALSLFIRKVPAANPAQRIDANPFTDIVTGAKTILARRSLSLSVVGISWFWFVGGLFQLALLLAGTEVFHVSEEKVGLLVTALAVGIALGSVMAGTISGSHIETGLVPFGGALMGVFSMALGLTSSYTMAVVWLVGVGFAGGLFVVPLNAVLQERAGSAEKGRILATNNFANMVGVICASGALWLLHDLLHWNAGTIIAALGAVTLAGSVGAAWIEPAVTMRFALRIGIGMLFRIRVEGAENLPTSGGALIAANHVSFVDALLLGGTTPRFIRFLMLKSMFDRPMFGRVSRMLFAIPVEPGSARGSREALVRAREELVRGNLVGIFPEGAITLTGEVHDFERGAERIVRDTGAPIVPVHIEGMFGHPLSYKGGGLWKSWDEVWRPVVTVRIGRPVHEAVDAARLRQMVVELGGR